MVKLTTILLTILVTFNTKIQTKQTLGKLYIGEEHLEQKNLRDDLRFQNINPTFGEVRRKIAIDEDDADQSGNSKNPEKLRFPMYQKTPQDIFRELIEHMERMKMTVNSTNEAEVNETVDYEDNQYETEGEYEDGEYSEEDGELFLNEIETGSDETDDTTIDEMDENFQPTEVTHGFEYEATQNPGDDIDLEDVLRGHSDETVGNLDYTDLLNQGFAETVPTVKTTLPPAFPELLRSIVISEEMKTKNEASQKEVNMIDLNTADDILNTIDDSSASLHREKPRDPRDIVRTTLPDSQEAPGEDLIDGTDQNLPDQSNYLPTDAAVDERLVIRTSSGSVLGRQFISSSGIQVVGFLGVPYAEPPVGPLRFLAPRPPQGWRGILNATSEPDLCWTFHSPQSWELSETGMSEDCLKLSIWVPSLQNTNLAVIVWLMEEQEIQVTGRTGGEQLAAVGEVVVVKVQSRRGSLGFLATSDKYAPGNVGLLDQVLALKWIENNIDLFGGDPSRITVLGYGRGAELSSLHLLSPLSCSLFNNMVLQSGSIPDRLLSRTKAHERAKNLARLVNCDTSSTEIMLDCLRYVDAQVLANQELNAANYSLAIEPFPPILDGYFIAEDPASLVAEGLIKETNLLIGSNANERLGALVDHLPELHADSIHLELSRPQLDSALHRIFPRYSEKSLSLLKFEYGLFEEDMLESVKDDSTRFWGVQAAVADQQVVCRMNQLGKDMSRNGGRVFRYFFKNNAEDLEAGSEMRLLLGQPLTNLGKPMLRPEADLSRRVIRLWSNFAKFGDPNGGSGEPEDRVWPEYTGPSWPHLNLNHRDMLVEDNLRGRVCVFWDSIMPLFWGGSVDLPPAKRSRSVLPRRGCGKLEERSQLYFPGYRPVNRL